MMTMNMNMYPMVYINRKEVHLPGAALIYDTNQLKYD